MLRGIGNKKLGLLFLSVFVLVVWNLSDYDVFGEGSGPGISRDSTNESLISQTSDKVDYFIRKKLNQMTLKDAELQGEAKPSAPLNSTSMTRTDSENRIQVYIHVHTLGPDVKSILESYGAIVEIINEKLKIVQARIPQDQVYEIAKLSFVKRISEPAYGVPRRSHKSRVHESPLSGGVTTEGDAILRADEVRARGENGSGAKVGVISNGVDSIATSIASGDLPSNGTVFLAGSGDEGTAMLEIIYDIAPGAELGFCGPATSLEFIDCVNTLANVFGADIIVDDLGHYGEPYFEDGPVALAVKDILPNRVYVSATGNDGKNHYTGNFIGSNTLGLTKNGAPVSEHDFGLASGGAADPTLDVNVGPGATIKIWLQWNDPFGRSANDYDLHLLNSSGVVIDRSEAVQNGDDDPYEHLWGTNPSSSIQTYKIAVTKVSGEDKQIKLFISGAVLLEYAVSAGSVFEHPAVPGVLAIAAINADDPGNDTIADYSAQGPVEIFFPSPETRQKPDITAIDKVSVTGAGGFDVPFYGTSAAAPHVAGVAALLIGGGASPEQAIQGIKDSAVDLGSAGFDNIFGYGRVDAFAAAEVLNVLPALPEPPKPKNDDGKGSAGTCFISTVN
jgi:subtilisin family serine protease